MVELVARLRIAVRRSAAIAEILGENPGAERNQKLSIAALLRCLRSVFQSV
jgi:hypothetical protein